MNKRFLVSVVVLVVVSMGFGFLVHGTVLEADYTQLANRGIYRSPAAAAPLMPYMFAANVIFAIGFTWIYRAGRDNRPWVGQGLRFGIAVALLSTIPTYLIYYVVTPLASDLVAKQVVLDSMVMVVLGVIAAFINRDPAPARA